ncbi:hypothetical protein [Wenjunlia tyrosinilytica]|uniref:TrbL/VirB6 plasmid conjugal transfer protein n=1 Tax=Wenjunlia tyrosinilytica TaxID=1544741 RepID=A0A918DZK7_9ACTN|nr:hypothetical protein [Wenjunlia tyrosinilytica]GGO95760.1 hypothetical protein GCM10012280_53700 [Wenjunlia tyrosinilytica]
MADTGDVLGDGGGSSLFDGIGGIFDFLSDPVGFIITGIAKAILAAAIDVMGELTKLVPTDATGEATRAISGQTEWVVVYTAVASLLVAAIRVALDRRGQPARQALMGILRVVLVAGGTTTVVGAASRLSDNFADHLFHAGATAQLKSISSGGGAGKGFLLLVLALLLLLSAIIQVIVMYIRLGVLVILIGTLPMAAAASMTGWGGGWWKRHIGWMTAWLLYKPAAALIIYSGSVMTASGGKLGQNIAGIGVLFLAVFALPALLRLVVPATAALGEASGGQIMLNGASSAASSLSGTGGQGGNSGGSGSQPTGSVSAMPSGSPSNGAAGLGGGGGKGSGGGAASGAAKSGGTTAAAAAAGPAAVAAMAVKTFAHMANAATSTVSDNDGSRGHNE